MRDLNWNDLGSGDGYVREAALRDLSGPAPNGFAMVLALRRLNDWVLQVRSAARDTLPALAEASDPEQVVDALCGLLPVAMLWGRAQAADRAVLERIVCLARITPCLRQRVMGAPAGPMPCVLAQSLRTAALDGHLPDIAKRALQPGVRALAHRTLITGQAAWVDGYRWQWTDLRHGRGRSQSVLGQRALEHRPALQQALDNAAADRSPLVRREAAKGLVDAMDTLGSAALPLARRLATDPSARIAERGTFVLRRLQGSPA
jgi:hypothetical protein